MLVAGEVVVTPVCPADWTNRFRTQYFHSWRVECIVCFRSWRVECVFSTRGGYVGLEGQTYGEAVQVVEVVMTERSCRRPLQMMGGTNRLIRRLGSANSS
ncbi:hypothetical protein CBR_g36574 [Chara braunii]|uniref:Uncharacterized protein n=1 Tax=Chara braunii TaxID=69332 RepID=A0A388JZ69_CHABU|nr:hypothetical protein CBR_g36574 [Chara braunii]|eukprot:GBG63088.1 hypothetical protein CBR_g36574 [Chara braunii]